MFLILILSTKNGCKLTITGNSLNVCDFSKSGVIILDLDHLTPEQATLIYNSYWQTKIKNRYNAKYIEVCKSSSNDPLRAKIFLFLEYNREFEVDENNIPKNIDLTHRRYRLDFEKFTGISTDSKMDEYQQLTFGVKTTDIQLPKTWLTHVNCSQPKSLDKNPNYKHVKIPDIIVPVNNQELKLLFNSPAIYFPRLEWISSHWNREQKRLFRHRINKGNRYKTLYKLITYVVFNALACNSIFNTSLSIKDCDKKILKLILETFDSPNTFLKEQGKSLMSSTYKIFNDIKESIQQKGLIITYLDLCKKFNHKVSFTYKSKQLSFTKLFDLLKDDLNKIAMHTERMAYLYKVSNYDKDLFKSLRICYRKSNLVTNEIKDGNFKISKYQHLKELYKESHEEVLITNIKEQIYCIKNGIKYTWNKIKTNFSFVTHEYIIPILLQLNNWLQIRNKVKSKTISLNDLKESNMAYNC